MLKRFICSFLEQSCRLFGAYCMAKKVNFASAFCEKSKSTREMKVKRIVLK